MGLDMYLHEVAYISRYSGLAESMERYKVEFEKADRILDEAGLFKHNVDGGVYVKSVVGYWRKANMVHQWFVDNCAEGTDDCRAVYVEDEKLTRLRDLCAMLLEKRSPSQAAAFLPTAEGFFFGGTDIDEWYWRDLEDTVQIIDTALANRLKEDIEGQVFNASHFEYEASW